jgi:hypothetical protein
MSHADILYQIQQLGRPYFKNVEQDKIVLV